MDISSPVHISVVGQEKVTCRRLNVVTVIVNDVVACAMKVSENMLGGSPVLDGVAINKTGEVMGCKEDVRSHDLAQIEELGNEVVIQQLESLC